MKGVADYILMFFAINTFLSVSLYVIVSLLSRREAFNMDRLRHRGKYHREGETVENVVIEEAHLEESRFADGTGSGTRPGGSR